MSSCLPRSILPVLVTLLSAATCAGEPADVDEVRFGYFGPADPDDPQGGDLWRAAQLAVEKANRDGGYRGKPFRLVTGWSKNPWGTGVAQVTRMVYDDKVRAIIGGIDGPSTHLAEQVVAKARLTLVSPVATDRSVHLANVPWTFSIAPGDHLLASALADGIVRQLGSGSFVSVAANDHDSHLFAVELKKCFAKLRIAPRFHFDCRKGAEDAAKIARRVVESKPVAAVVIAGPEDGAKLVAALREQGFGGTIFGGPTMARQAFLRQATDTSDHLVFPLPQERATHISPAPDSKISDVPFLGDYAAAQTYDAVCLLVAAVRKAGLERGAIRDAVKELSPFRGVSGTVQWDRFGGNTRAVGLGTIIDGRVESYRPPRGPAGSTPR